MPGDSGRNREQDKDKDRRSLRSSRSTRSLRNANNNATAANPTGDKGVVRAIKNIFLRASLSLSLAAHRLRSFAEDALSSDEVVNELFLVTSSSSVASSLLEQELSQDQEETSQTTGNNTNMALLDSSDTKSSVPAWQDFDAGAEAEQLRAQLGEDEPFVEGVTVWEKRRAAWTACTRQDSLRVKQRILDNSLSVPKENYAVVYTSLVEKGKTLKKPMNLKDALKVVNAGWIATKKWERAAQGIA